MGLNLPEPEFETYHNEAEWEKGITARVQNGWKPVSTWSYPPSEIHVAYVGPAPNAV